MGIDDNNTMVHENINDGTGLETLTTGTITAAPSAYNIQFYGGTPNQQVYLTITREGELVPGPGLSMDEATQEAAKMLAEHFGRNMERIRREEDAKRA